MNEPPLSFFVDLTFRLFLPFSFGHAPGNAHFFTLGARARSPHDAPKPQGRAMFRTLDPLSSVRVARPSEPGARVEDSGARPASARRTATHGLLCFVSSSPVGRQDLFLGLGHRLALGARGQAPLLGALHVVAGHAGGGKGEGERERREREGDEQGRVGWSESERVREQRGAFSRESPNPGACRPQSAPRSRSCKTPGTLCATVHWAGQASPAVERGGGGAVRRTTRG